MQKTCISCGNPFSITDEDLVFYDRVSPVFAGKKYPIPPPTHCPDCRRQRRWARRNERNLHRRTCSLTGQGTVSFYPEDTPFPVYDQDAWWSDKWDPLSFGRDYDFNTPFFDQFEALQNVVPRIGMVIKLCENCNYAPYSVESKNCYMCVSCFQSEDLQNCYQTNYSKDCYDCSITYKSELCYDCLYCISLFESAYCKDCENGSNLYFCNDCRGCTNCIGCKNLNNKENHIFNKPVTPEEFAAAKAELQTYSGREKWRKQSHEFWQTLPSRHAHLINCENCTGDHVQGSKNGRNCFNANNFEDCSYCCFTPNGMKDSQDFDYVIGAELVYDSLSAVMSYAARFCLHSWEDKEILYCDECFNSQYLFGCIGVKQKQYCILNKQYTEEEYNDLVPKIIAHMESTKEWGEYFPVRISPFGYNESIAQGDFPLTKEDVQKKGYKWVDIVDEKPEVEKIIPALQLPDSLDAIPDDVLNWAIECAVSKRPFRLSKQELGFYRSQSIPIPRLCPDERHVRRMALSNPKKLYTRQCAKCNKEIETSYDAGKPEKVYCEECYLAEVY